MDTFINKIRSSAKKNPKRIVFPESTEIRILKAIEIIQKEGLATIILVGNPTTIKETAKTEGLQIDWEKIQIEDPQNSELSKKYTKAFFELRKNKGMTEEKAEETMKNSNYFATMMVEENDADGMVTGATMHTADAIKPALQIIKTHEKFHKVSGIYFMVLDDRLLLFADTAVNINPNSHDLVDIAIDTAETATKFGIDPRVALLSFSTKGTDRHPEIDKIKEALAIIKSKKPDLIIDGELQVDAALVKEIAEKKCPDSPIQGDANILIFPNLQAGNIAYKLVERLAKAKAIGPLLQGLKKPINDLSRGCDHNDIVNITAFTVHECS